MPPRNDQTVPPKIDRATVEHVARLARLHLSDDEIQRFGGQLGDILGYVEQVCELGEADPEASTRPGPQEVALRADEVTPSLPRDEVLSNAPASEAGQFRVPPVLE